MDPDYSDSEVVIQLETPVLIQMQWQYLWLDFNIWYTLACLCEYGILCWLKSSFAWTNNFLGLSKNICWVSKNFVLARGLLVRYRNICLVLIIYLGFIAHQN